MKPSKPILVATAVLVPAVLLVLIEVGLHLGGYGTRADFFVPIEGQDALTTNPNFARQFFRPALARLPQRIRVEEEKSSDVTRIVVLGGSAAMGEPEPSFSFSRVLDVMLGRMYPNRRFEVVNTGMATINSHVVRLIAQELTRVGPDIVLIYMGNNEVVGPYGAGTVFGSYSPSLTLIRAGIWLRQFRLGQLLESVARWVGGASQYVNEGQGMALFRGQTVTADDPRLERIYSHFEQNLYDIISLAEEAGALVVVSTVATNTADHAPFASLFGQEHSNPLTWGQLYANGVGHEEAGDTLAAIAAYEMVGRVDSTHAELQYRLGQLYRDQGRMGEARERLIRARDLDALRFRADSHINAIVRQVSSERGVTLVDSDRSLNAEDETGLQLEGASLFHEHVHLDDAGNYAVASGIADQLTVLLGEPANERPTPDTCASDLGLFAWERYRLYASVAGLMERAPFTNQYDFLVRLKRSQNRLNALRAEGTSDQAFASAGQAYLDAMSRRPNDLAIRQNYARFDQASGALVEAASPR